MGPAGNRGRTEAAGKPGLGSRLKARIFTSPEVFMPTLEIFSDGEAIVLRGVVHTPREYQAIREIVHQTVDRHLIRNELHYRK